MKIALHPRITQPFRPQDYILHEALKNAVEVAIALGQPLLLTGEPGTGKTKLAQKVALDLSSLSGSNFADKPLIFNTKTTSAARDLFYTYDALSHFQAANIKQLEGAKTLKMADFIELQALGKAIAFSNPAEVDGSKFSTPLPAKPQSSIVLIDEIDKAPRDFTNDILDEIENYRFSMKEQDNYHMAKSDDQHIVVIMTSNSEKNLPDAFLRRCVFYHIPFPTDDLLRDIVKTQLGGSTKFTEQMLDTMIEKFNAIRKRAVRKPPATAELIAWLRILEMQNFMEANDAKQRAQLLDNLSILVKTREDLEAVKGVF
ncbi:MAG: MoxR family ATPase [Saprospiraceae bacterium]|nr:MoxR family ATPase [Saprospiraceae bacterium]MCF8249911.1 MoxR family ATPase [Saprospiraceae bacterium]MCF8279324.1 MoxR family ATPase [Bacteroidales bacterium]MCF8310015.1 MoxR family ATPase [Saprospiraceae bacterium]MCF8438915.1 MoxR family ATPase [Saprospiraceae bacterium]